MATVKERRLRELLAAVDGLKRLCILTHFNPDPDCISAAWALQRVILARTKCKAEVVYAGIIGRAENQSMVRLLGIDLLHFNLIDHEDFDGYALVDTQPGTGNNPLPDGIDPVIVLDHHPRQAPTKRAKYADLRENLGATATMMFEYADTAGIRLDSKLATALFYGIKSETHNLGRGVTRADVNAYLALFRKVKKEVVSDIEHAPLTTAYFVMLDRAIKGTTVHGPLVVSVLGNVENPDMVSECADLMLRLEHVQYAFSLGRFNGDLCLSLRTSDSKIEAGQLLKSVVAKDGTAGGHAEMAGGIIDGHRKGKLGANKAACRELSARMVKKLRIKNGEAEGAPLLEAPDNTPSQQVIRALLRTATDAKTG